MEKNEIIQQVIDTIRTDILSNKQFVMEVLKNVQLTEKNVDPNLILKMMSDMNPNFQPPRPKTNAPKNISASKVMAKPQAIGEGTQVASVVSDLLEGNNVFLVGKAGTGKTYLAESMGGGAKEGGIMGQKYYEINCSQWTSPIEIKGGQTIKGYQEGLLIKAWAEGAILILDELPKLDPNTAGLLNAALADTARQPSYDEQGNVYEDTVPFIVNGRGEMIYKGQDQTNKDLKYRFCVIATGNTDMMTLGNKYSGNNRQDYSLVDRFAGSYYYLEAAPITEMRLTYPYVYNVCNAMRKFLDARDALQSISLRTMLNFNRTYEQEMLYKLGGADGKSNPFADQVYDNNGNLIPPKSVEDSINSFLSMLEKNLRESLQDDADFREARKAENRSEEEFIKVFMGKYKLNPITGDSI